MIAEHGVTHCRVSQVEPREMDAGDKRVDHRTQHGTTCSFSARNVTRRVVLAWTSKGPRQRFVVALLSHGPVAVINAGVIRWYFRNALTHENRKYRRNNNSQIAKEGPPPYILDIVALLDRQDFLHISPLRIG